MLALRKLDEKFIRWNREWHAPFGRKFIKKLFPRKLQSNMFIQKYAGVFSFQPNSDTRSIEYPWAYYASALEPGMNVLDIGGGFSGFPFVLSKMGMNVVNVDPILDYGPLKHYNSEPEKIFRYMNSAFSANVQLKRTTLKEAKLPDESFDRIYSISALEHIPSNEIQSIMKEVYRILKPNGLAIFTIDLFLNLIPFTKREHNEYGKNVSVKGIIDMSSLELIEGNKMELYGYEEFDSNLILENLEKYYISTTYPVLTQMIVLKKIVPE